jgi:hypothetical protein
MVEQLVLHAGTPKTGTTSLQRALQQHRAALADRGFFIPPTTDQLVAAATGGAIAKPKHQFLVDALRDRTEKPLRTQLEAALAAAPSSAHTAILSSEGLYHHWWDFADASRAELAGFGRAYQLQLWVWFREPQGFFASSYVQMLKNPPGRVPCYGRDWSPEQMLDDPWFARRLDYAGFVGEAADCLGSGALRLFPWRHRTVHDFLAALGQPDLNVEEPTEHPTPGALGAAMLRALNRGALRGADRAAAVGRIVQLDASLGPASPRFDPGPAVRQRLDALTAPGLAWLRREWGLCLPSGPD